jgi:hypothetical protein
MLRQSPFPNFANPSKKSLKMPTCPPFFLLILLENSNHTKKISLKDTNSTKLEIQLHKGTNSERKLEGPNFKNEGKSTTSQKCEQNTSVSQAVMITFSFHLLTSYQSLILDFGEIHGFFKGNSNIQESEASFAICTVSTLTPVWLPVMILLLKTDVVTSLVMHHSFINPDKLSRDPAQLLELQNRQTRRRIIAD